MVRIGVLANVHGRQVQAEHGDRALDPGQQAVSDQLAAVRPQRVADQCQVGEQLALAEVVAARVRAATGVDPPPGVGDLAVHAGQLEPVRLGRR